MAATRELRPSSIFRALSLYHVETSTLNNFNHLALKKFQTLIQWFNSINPQRSGISKMG